MDSRGRDLIELTTGSTLALDTAGDVAGVVVRAIPTPAPTTCAQMRLTAALPYDTRLGARGRSCRNLELEGFNATRPRQALASADGYRLAEYACRRVHKRTPRGGGQ